MSEIVQSDQKRVNVPYPMPEVFKYQRNIHNPAQEIIAEQAMFVLKEVLYPETGGIFAYFEGVPYPQKGFPFPEAIYAVNAVKRMSMEVLKASVKKDVIFSLFGFLFLPRKYKIKMISRFMNAYVNSADMFLHPYFLKERYYSSACKEIKKFMVTFFEQYGIEHSVANDFSDVVVTLIDYDNAYRLRIEDAMSEVTKKEFLENPAQTINKMIDIIASREFDGSKDVGNALKFTRIAKMVKFGLWFKSIRKPFMNALYGSQFENFQLDEADAYHVLLWADYNFLGLTIQDRIKKYEEFHAGKLPPRIICKPAPMT